jgi:hypothetical protein
LGKHHSAVAQPDAYANTEPDTFRVAFCIGSADFAGSFTGIDICISIGDAITVASALTRPMGQRTSRSGGLQSAEERRRFVNRRSLRPFPFVGAVEHHQ